jgi:phage FluMu protein Com
MSRCHIHVDCPWCHRIVVPIVQISGSFETKYCPRCGEVISDVCIAWEPPRRAEKGKVGR